MNIGVAAHITAAAPGGARHDGELSGEARSAAENGIWLCQNCAKRIDNDASRYPVELLRAWKMTSEAATHEALGVPDGRRDVAAPERPLDKVIVAIATNARNLRPVVRSFMGELSTRLGAISAELTATGQPTFKAFQSGIEESRPLVREFAEIAGTAAEFNAEIAGPEIMRGFEGVLDLYEQHGGGIHYRSGQDIAHFVGHELFVNFAAALILQEQWVALRECLNQSVFALRNGEKRPATYHDLRDRIVLADELPAESNSRWRSAHGELLRIRYASDDMPTSFAAIVHADYVLYLSSACDEKPHYKWFPVTWPYLKDPPECIVRCKSLAHLKQVLGLFGSGSVDEFREKFNKHRVPHRDADRFGLTLLKPESVGSCP